MRKQERGRDTPTLESARELALDALLFLAQDGQRMSTFFTNTGMAPDDLRTTAREDGTLAAVLGHLLGDESLLLVFTAHSRHPPETVQPALATLERDGGSE